MRYFFSVCNWANSKAVICYKLLHRIHPVLIKQSNQKHNNKQLSWIKEPNAKPNRIFTYCQLCYLKTPCANLPITLGISNDVNGYLARWQKPPSSQLVYMQAIDSSFRDNQPVSAQHTAASKTNLLVISTLTHTDTRSFMHICNSSRLLSFHSNLQATSTLPIYIIILLDWHKA